MLCVMHEATPYGSLLIKGKRIDKKQLASLAAVPEKECVVLMLELEGFGVFDRDEDGTIYSRRMRRDHSKSEEGRKQIAKRWGDENQDRSPNRSATPETTDEPNTQKPEARIDRIGSAGASSFTDGSKSLANAFWKALGWNSPLEVPPEFAGIDWRAVGWEKAGWTTDLIEVEARKVGPAKPLSYHEKCFATAFAKRQAPLPIVEIKSPDKITVKHGTSQANSGSLIAAIDRQLAALEAEASADFALPENPVLRISG